MVNPVAITLAFVLLAFSMVIAAVGWQDKTFRFIGCTGTVLSLMLVAHALVVNAKALCS